MAALHPVLLSGGSGTRLWPLSRAEMPKQFLSLAGLTSLLSDTALRVRHAGMGDPLVICAERHEELVVEQLGELGITPARIVLESVARNTAPAVAVAAMLLPEDDFMLVLPADQWLPDHAAFAQAVATGMHAAGQGRLVTFGLMPSHAETAYGYIAQGAALDDAPGVFAIDRFVEKPDLETATRYLAERIWLWNSGMFLFPVGVLRAEMRRHAPEVMKAAEAAVARGRQRNGRALCLDAAALEPLEGISVDYALMEKTTRAAVVPADFAWSDVGSWVALWDLGSKDRSRNVVEGEVVMRGVQRSYLRSDGPLLAAIGVKDLICVAMNDAVLVADRSQAQEVRVIVDELRQRDPERLTHALAIHHPWGTVDEVTRHAHGKVERLRIEPGRRAPLAPTHGCRIGFLSATARLWENGHVVELVPGLDGPRVERPAELENPGNACLEAVIISSLA